MKDKLVVGITWVVVLAVVLLFIWGGYALQRNVNWSLSYQDRVEQAIEERVAPLEARIEELENAEEKE
jgi:uncharacterized membrane protein